MKRSILIALLGLIYTTAQPQTLGQIAASGGLSFVSGYANGAAGPHDLMRLTSNAATFMSTGVSILPSKATPWWDMQWACWMRMRWENPNKKPIMAYVSEFVWLSACRKIGYTSSYDWIYRGK